MPLVLDRRGILLPPPLLSPAGVVEEVGAAYTTPFEERTADVTRTGVEPGLGVELGRLGVELGRLVSMPSSDIACRNSVFLINKVQSSKKNKTH